MKLQVQILVLLVGLLTKTQAQQDFRLNFRNKTNPNPDKNPTEPPINIPTQTTPQTQPATNHFEITPIDFCAESKNPCNSDEICENTKVGKRCKCKNASSFEKNVKSNKCELVVGNLCDLDDSNVMSLKCNGSSICVGSGQKKFRSDFQCVDQCLDKNGDPVCGSEFVKTCQYDKETATVSCPLSTQFIVLISVGSVLLAALILIPILYKLNCFSLCQKQETYEVEEDYGEDDYDTLKRNASRKNTRDAENGDNQERAIMMQERLENEDWS